MTNNINIIKRKKTIHNDVSTNLLAIIGIMYGSIELLFFYYNSKLLLIIKINIF